MNAARGARRLVRVGLALVLWPGCAAKQVPEETPIVCEIPTNQATWKVESDRELPPAYWMKLLLPAYDARSGLVARPLRSCRGLTVKWGPAHPCFVETEGTPAAEVPLTRGDVTVAPAADPAERLVWVAAQHHSTGEADGPVALARFRAETVVVSSLGMMRLLSDNVRLRLATFGETTLVLAEGESCLNRPAGQCERVVRVMALRGDRIVPTAIKTTGAECLNDGLIHLALTQNVQREGRGFRMVLTASLDPAPEGFVLDERLEVLETRSERTDDPGRLIQKFREKRLLRVQGASLVADGPSILVKVDPEAIR